MHTGEIIPCVNAISESRTIRYLLCVTSMPPFFLQTTDIPPCSFYENISRKSLIKKVENLLLLQFQHHFQWTVNGQRGLPGVHAQKETFHVTVLRAVTERVQTPHQPLVAGNAADTPPRTSYVSSAVLVSRLQINYNK